MLHKVKKIHIGEFTGPKDELDEFLEKLRAEFTENKFELVDDKMQADGILKGAMQIKKGTDKFGGNLLLALERMGAFALDDEDLLRVTLRLTTPQGKKLWAGNFQRSVRSVSGLELARLRAKDVMKKFMRDYQNARFMSEVDIPDSNDNDDYLMP